MMEIRWLVRCAPQATRQETPIALQESWRRGRVVQVEWFLCGDVRGIGDAVVRRQGSSALFVHALLRHLADVGWVGSPRVLGVDDEGNETLTFLASLNSVT